MNLAMLERMARTGDVSLEAAQYLVRCRAECEWLDYKVFLHLQDDKPLCDFTRDVVAIKNTGGGYIVVGVADKTWELVGLPQPLPYDAKQLRDKLRKCSGLELDVDIVHHEVTQYLHRRLVALIYVRASRKRKKRRTPTVIGIDYLPQESFGLRRGEIYFRRGDSTVRVRSEEELHDLLDDLEAHADEEGRQLADAGSVFAIEEGLNRLLERGFETFIGRHVLRSQLLQAVTRDPRIWIVNVHGPGGVGKSALVNWAAYEFFKQKKFDSIIHLTAKETALTQSGIRRVTRNLYSLENLLDQVLSVFEEPTTGELQQKKTTVTEILSAWSTLLVLDNMETVTDGRILTFVQELPVDTKAKILMTSRSKTGGWELSVPVNELGLPEIKEFVEIKSVELGIDGFPLDEEACDRIARASGGLPLAIQWIMGRFRATGNLGKAVGDVSKMDSPVLEFTFRNIWTALTPDSKAILCILTIFESPPTIQQISIATAWILEKVGHALDELGDVTLVTKQTHPRDGRVVYVALPITLSFARYQLGRMGDFETICRQRFQRYTDQMNLQESEVARFANIFERYGINDDNDRRAVILCRRAESEMFTGNVDNAEMLFRQARELAPTSAYVLAMSASYEIARNRIGFAIDFAKDACGRCTKVTGALCYQMLARALDIQRDRQATVAALETAIGYDPKDLDLRHRLGVALSRAGKTDRAIAEFTHIIECEKNVFPARQTLLAALKTRIINFRRQGKTDEADRDLAFAKEVLGKNPHLQRTAYQFADLQEGDD